MDGPSNFVVHHCNTDKFEANFEICLYWRIGGPTYHTDKPYLLKEQRPQDMVVRRRWHRTRDDDPGFRMEIWQSGWQDWNLLLISKNVSFRKPFFSMGLPHTCSYPRIPNNEVLRDAGNEYIRQICFGFLHI